MHKTRIKGDLCTINATLALCCVWMHFFYKWLFGPCMGLINQFGGFSFHLGQALLEGLCGQLFGWEKNFSYNVMSLAFILVFS